VAALAQRCHNPPQQDRLRIVEFRSGGLIAFVTTPHGRSDIYKEPGRTSAEGGFRWMESDAWQASCGPTAWRKGQSPLLFSDHPDPCARDRLRYCRRVAVKGVERAKTEEHHRPKAALDAIRLGRPSGVALHPWRPVGGTPQRQARISGLARLATDHRRVKGRGGLADLNCASPPRRLEIPGGPRTAAVELGDVRSDS